jgi:hypothetical protein
MAREFTADEWAHAHALYSEGATYAEIAGKLRTQPRVISERARAEGWERIEQKTRDEIYREFVEQNFEIVMQSLTKDAELNARLRGLCEKHISRMEGDQDLWIQVGTDKEGDPVYAKEDPIKSIRSLGQTLQAISASHSEIAAQALLVASNRPSDTEHISASDEEILSVLGVN